jgi:hypothetical protein
MSCKLYGAFIASLSVVALLLPANETFARSGAAGRAPTFAPTHSVSRPAFAQSFRNHRRGRGGILWPAYGDYYGSNGDFYGSSNGEPFADVTQPVSGETKYTYKYDVPWDWAHRYPPMVIPSDRPYVPSCPAENVTVPGQDGGERTVSIMRCY